MTSRGQGHRAETEVPVQYIHVPKAGGTTIQYSLGKMLKKVLSVRPERHNGDPAHCHNLKPLEAGKVYEGHAPIGYFSTNYYAASPIYIVCNREPLSLMASLFDFRNTFTGQTGNTGFLELVKQTQNATKRLAAEGKDPTSFLDHLVRSGDEHIPDFTRFFVPCGCAFSDSSNLTASAMHNVLRIDVVAVLEDFGSLIPQLEYHLPWLKPFDMLNPANVHSDRSQRQVLSEEAIATLQGEPLFVSQSKIYALSRDVAEARARFAERCMSDRGCDGVAGDQVPVKLSQEAYDLLKSTAPRLRKSSCVVPPAAGYGWPPFYSDEDDAATSFTTTAAS
eukprot:CAMPEP_0198660346 /NCGR_PEP_ID=MMETSP1467-20131203/36392_1 /TAXON_ID=1462469 /ORGANISM="unid. sp., Strain CCMP2135" /LENGTH=334 /DNA_ID=CAMNT_0044396749 /DNA_START=98 /DNA_END=1102 /DNA_ORIENTATION=+